jgi:putative oxidoreductase
MSMSRLYTNKLVVVASRILLGVVFIVAAIDKIAVPEAFAVSVEAYRIVPTAMVNVFALIVPWLELLCGIFLVAGVYVRSSALILGVLLVSFVAAIVWALAQGLKIDCGCFGAAHATPVGWMRVLEDVGLLALALHQYLLRPPVSPVSTESSAAAPGVALR